MEESREQRTVVFALIVTEPASDCVCFFLGGGEGCNRFQVFNPPTPHIHQLAGSATINARTTVHCSLDAIYSSKESNNILHRNMVWWILIFASILLVVLRSGFCFVYIEFVSNLSHFRIYTLKKKRVHYRRSDTKLYLAQNFFLIYNYLIIIIKRNSFLAYVYFSI